MTTPFSGFPEGIFRTNWTEIFSNTHTAQCQLGNAKPRCADFQLNAAECLEAYGARRGRVLCKDYLQDLNECLKHDKQYERVTEMRKERMRQVLRGERKITEFHDPNKPPRDSFQRGPFHPC